MKENYNYPLDLSWSTTEMTEVLSFSIKLKFYESKVEKEVFLESYNAFKKIVPSKMQEKQAWDVDFELSSGYSLYHAVKEVKLVENDLSVLTRLELAKDWVRDAGNFLKENIAAPLEITEKTRYDDLVTNFDKEVQEQIVANILHHFPEDKI